MSKRWLYGIGTIGAIAAPMAAVVACGDDDEDSDYGWETTGTVTVEIPDHQTMDLSNKESAEVVFLQLSKIDSDIYQRFGINQANPDGGEPLIGHDYVNSVITRVDRILEGSGSSDANIRSYAATQGITTGEQMVSWIVSSDEFKDYTGLYVDEDAVLVSHAIRDEFFFEFDGNNHTSQMQKPFEIKPGSYDEEYNFTLDFFKEVKALIEFIDRDFPSKTINLPHAQYWLIEPTAIRDVNSGDDHSNFYYTLVTDTDKAEIDAGTSKLDAAVIANVPPIDKPLTLSVDINPLIDSLMGKGSMYTATIDELIVGGKNYLTAIPVDERKAMYYDALQLVDLIQGAGSDHFYLAQNTMSDYIHGLGDYFVL